MVSRSLRNIFKNLEIFSRIQGRGLLLATTQINSCKFCCTSQATGAALSNVTCATVSVNVGDQKDGIEGHHALLHDHFTPYASRLR